MYRKLLLAAVVLMTGIFLAGGCSEKKAAETPVQKSDLQHHRFELAHVDGKAFETMADRPAPFIEFGENFTLNGRICNSFHGQATLENNILTVDRMASTMMICPDDASNDLERLFGPLLNEGAKVRLSGNTLVLTGKEHELTYTLKDLVN